MYIGNLLFSLHALREFKAGKFDGICHVVFSRIWILDNIDADFVDRIKLF